MTRIEAIELSIEHWHENLCFLEEGKDSYLTFRVADCALCRKYFRDGKIPCPFCPLSDVSWCNEKGSLYHKAKTEKTTEAFLNLIDTLETLRDKYENKKCI